MLSAEEKKEKEDFFRDLDRLENLEADDEEQTDMSAPELSPKRPSNKVNTYMPGSPPTRNRGVVDLKRNESRKRKLSREASGPEQRTAPYPRLARATTLPKQGPKQNAPVKPRFARATTLPESPTKPNPFKLANAFTDLSNLEARLRGTDLPKLRPLPKGKVWKPLADIPVNQQIFQGLMFFFVPNNDDDPGARMRIHQAIKYGAKWAHKYCGEVTHVLVTRDELNVKMVAKSFPENKIPEGPFLLRHSWLWESWKYGCQPTGATRFQVPGAEALNHADKLANPPPANTHSVNTGTGGNPRQFEATNDALELAISDVRTGADLQLDLDTPEASGGEDDPIAKASNKNTGYMCMDSHGGTTKSQNPNARTIGSLQKMADSYQTSDQWRTKAFRQAISKLRRQDRVIRTHQEARDIGIGESIATQIEEMVSTGRYKRLEYAQNDPKNQIVKLFTGVYGAGETTARKWIAQGYRSLEDLHQNKAALTANQQIGLEHYDDFQKRIPRSEVAQHAAMVEQALKAADAKLQIIIGGSYRRGSEDSGDIDCIIFMEGADIVHIRTLMIDTVIPKLMEQGFLKVALASGHSSSDDSSKWHGASALPGSEVWRRIDFLFVPCEELGAALIYFTGNDLFNRSIRFLAGKKGMRLNQHGLCKDVMRGPRRQRINNGTLVESRNERRIFEILGVPYRPPEERNV